MASPDHDASKDSLGESTPGGEETEQRKREKKRRRDEKDGRELSASPVERPSRERKSVVRYAAATPRRLLVNKAVNFQQGSGERLKDIPNVAFKLSKRKSDESLRVLHKILFGRKANVHFVKRNILQFSGFVWPQNEEKGRSKVKEKLNKCNKEKLLEYCDLLDVYTLKATTKKEEISEKLLEFLESPRATREVILSEKDTKGKKRRRGVKGTGERTLEEASPDRERKRSKMDENFEAKKDRKKPAKADRRDLGKSVSIDTDLGDENKKDDAEEASEHSYGEAEDDNVHEPESTKILSGEELNVHEEPKSKEKSPAVRKGSRAKSKATQSTSATPTKKAKGKTKVLSESKTSKKTADSSKVVKNETPVKKYSKDNSTRKVSRRKGEPGSKGKEKEKSDVGISSENAKESKKRVVKIALKGKHKDALVEPSRESLHDVVAEILKEVDFNVVTLADIIKQLGAHFNTDLMHRKAEIKDILEVVINNMTDDEEDGDDDGDGSAEK